MYVYMLLHIGTNLENQSLNVDKEIKTREAKEFIVVVSKKDEDGGGDSG